MKVVIRRRVTSAALESVLPRRYSGLALAARPLEVCTVITFAPERVTCSNDAKRALKQIEPSDHPVVAFASDFTIEASKMLDEAGVRMFSLRFFGWTDERYQAR